MITGNGITSLRKADLTDQKNIATGFQKLQFAHLCAGGETGINLNSLTIPTQMSSQGFTNPSGAALASANLTTYRRNLKLKSSLRGELIDFFTYTVSATGTQITFLGFTASPGEIFVGTLDYNAVSGIQVVSATGQPATGILTAGSTDFNIGYAIPTNQYSTTQLGGVSVYLDGVLQTRNPGNSSTVLTANYFELDNGSGNFSVIRFNIADPSNDRNVIVLPNGLLVNNADGVLSSVVQTQAGQINQMANYVAALAGQPITTVLGGSPSYTDLQSFGNSVAYIGRSNTFVGQQNFTGSLLPTAGLSYDLGSAALPWHELHVGPSSLLVHNDLTNTQLISIGYSGVNASIDCTPGNTNLYPSMGANTLTIGSTTGTVLFQNTTTAKSMTVSGDNSAVQNIVTSTVQGPLILNDPTSAVGRGGLLLFGCANTVWAGLKGDFVNGGIGGADHGIGNVHFLTRIGVADATLTDVGSFSSSGVWTLGPASAGVTHKINGALKVADGSAVYSNFSNITSSGQSFFSLSSLNLSTFIVTAYGNSSSFASAYISTDNSGANIQTNIHTSSTVAIVISGGSVTVTYGSPNTAATAFALRVG